MVSVKFCNNFIGPPFCGGWTKKLQTFSRYFFWQRPSKYCIAEFTTILVCLLLKLVPATFYQIFIFHHMIALQKLWKMFFISSKKLYSFSRYSNFSIFVFPAFFPCQPLPRGWFNKNLKIYDAINCLYKNLKAHFVWYLEKKIRCGIDTLSIDRKLNKKHFYGNTMQKMCFKS